MNTPFFLFNFLSITLSLFNSINAQTTAQKPNIIVIMLDDLGYADLGFHGCKDIKTPHIDNMAENGITFSSAYATYPVCGPSRAGFITGRYQQKFGFERNPQYDYNDIGMGLPLDEKTIANYLGDAGYSTGAIGKWHLGAHPDLWPLKRGFDEFYGHIGGGHVYTKSNNWKENQNVTTEWASYNTWLVRNNTPENPDSMVDYLTHQFTNEALDFIDRKKEEPFFLYLAYNAPHDPLEAPQEYLDQYATIEDEKRQKYAAMVAVVDEGVGKIMDKLEALGLEDNTLIFLLSDNGGPETKNASDNGVLRGAKSDVYEGGIRVPFLMYWKGEISPKVYDKPVSSLDIMATAAALNGIEAKEDKPFDGVNLIPYVRDGKEGTPHEAIYIRKFDDNRFSIRKGDYKLVQYKDRQWPNALYNLKEDIGETTNIKSENQEIFEDLQNELNTWEAGLIYPVFLGLIHRDAKARQIIDYEEVGDKKMTDFPITIDVIASSYLPVTLEILSGDASINGQEITINKAGNIEVKASQAGNEKHEPAPEEIISFSVSKADQEIIFSEITDKSMLEFPYTLEVTSTGNLPITFEVVKGSASITNNVINVVEAGEIKIKTTQLGNNFYNSAEEKIIGFNTYKANQDLVLSEIDTKTSSDSPFEIEYTSNSSNNIIYNVSGPAIIENGFLHLIGESGNVELSALQEATSIYNSGSDSISFEVINSNSEITNIENISSIYTVYPNPTTDFLIIKGVQNKSRIELIGLLGTQFTAKVKHNTVDVRNLPIGTYFLIIDGVEKLRFIKK